MGKAVTYFKRFRMEAYLNGRDLPSLSLPAGYDLHPWHPELLAEHADAKYRSFRGEIDADVFPCLGSADGCYRLMKEISNKRGFLPESTWLLSWQGEYGEPREYCGTIQGIRDRGGYGGVQNLGIAPGHRGQGLAAIMMNRALCGFRFAGLQRAYLEVTARNGGAIRLYERLGFIRVRTVYKAVDVQRRAAVSSA
ncbi:MAG TPA: GNAT family N-acetyltransferase [Pirellulales bacterium]|nr:GNAT family N-acetyltransferase [Pirellulales bacterium]